VQAPTKHELIVNSRSIVHLSDARNNSKVWVKQTRAATDADGPYELRQFELNCGARQIRTLSFANYDESGSLVRTREGGSLFSSK